MGLAEQIEMRLREAFAPEQLEVRNDSARHAGHAGDDGTGESHWHVTIVSAGFAGQSRIARHRAVHAALGADIMGRIHALGLDLREV
ncbi:BolA family transcriptional regulator [Loktanella sp. IMCC34160]|uniref:BolA family protein n=1 Tax=Loktanella sp. IMCC34160 TaxID=2510646 RepID=UPI00101CCA01|nr:BolA family protein [Loktanella sp. IMCC34160]RYG91753.1 BolA family transcriptional regulator [Loktanella sp. IMCC34160]